MSITVRIPTQLRTLTQGRNEVVAEGATVSAAIEDLERNHPGLRARLLDERGVRRFINLFVNDEDVRYLGGLETPLREGDSLTIVPAVAGG
ncbi:MAG: ubiquitin-like small modifier protein 1 [Polyangiales bacterium]